MEEKSERLRKLQQQKAKVDLAIQRERNKLKGQARKDDTRRKIIVGALMLAEAENDPAMFTRLNTLLKKTLTRADDRALFDLPPLPDNENASPVREKESA